MRVCFCFSNFHLAHITGQAGLMMQLIQKTKNHSSHVFVISNDLRSEQFTKDGIDYYLIKGLGDFKTYFSNFLQIVHFIKKIKPDVIHVNGILMTIYIWIITCFLRIPFFSLVSETIDNINPLYQNFYYLASKSCKYIFVTSNFLKKQLLEIGVEKKKIKVVRIGLDEKYQINYRKSTENYDTFYFGDSTRDRGFDYVVGLAQELKNLKFLISIRYQYQDCKSELETAKQLSNVKLMFYPYKESLQSLITQSKLVVLPYRWMLIRPPISLLESMALGKCVITSKMAVNEEVIQNNKNGILSDFTNLDQVASQITYLINNRTVLQRMGERAKKTIKTMYSDDEYNKIIDYYALCKS